MGHTPEVDTNKTIIQDNLKGNTQDNGDERMKKTVSESVPKGFEEFDLDDIEVIESKVFA